MLRLQNKTAIITGASGGIGMAIARQFAQQGARVALAGLNREALQKAATDISEAAPGSAISLQCDVGSEEQVRNTVRATVEHFGQLDIIVNNAGIMMFKPLPEWTGQDWLRILRVDLLGAAFFTAEAFRHMTAGGSIVNVASVHAVMTSSLVAPYAAAKAALLSLTRSTAIEGKPHGIRANAILPGAIDTPMLWSNPNIKSGEEKLDAADVGEPEDIAAAAMFLASDEAKFITGTTLTVDGGRLAKL